MICSLIITFRDNNMRKLFTILLMSLLLSRYAYCDLSELSESAIDKRYNHIQKAFEKEQEDAYWWQHGWEAAYAGSSIFQAAKAFTADNGNDEIRFGVGAAKSLVALSVIYSNPLPALSLDVDTFETARTKSEKIKRLAQAERHLHDRAQSAENIHSWKRHGSAILFNLSTSAIIAVFGNEKDAIASAVGGILASELNIWTQPNSALQDWENYQKHNASKVSWLLLPTASGIALNIRF